MISFWIAPLTRAKAAESQAQSGSQGQSQSQSQSEEQRVNEVTKLESEHLYGIVPDIDVQSNIGTLKLSSLWSEKPLLLTLFYKDCTGACSPFLRSLHSAIDKTGGLGTDYNVASLSFDPNDSAESVQRFSKSLGIPQTGKWVFGISDQVQLDRLVKSIGFWYKLDSQTKQYDHPTMVVAIERGKIIRVLVGAIVSKARFKELTWELKGKFVPFYTIPGKNTIFRCLAINEVTKEVQLNWGLLVLLFPGVASLSMAAFLFRKKPSSEV